MTAIDKTTALAMLLGAFIFFVIVFFLIVGCVLCLTRFRKKQEDQEILMDSAMSPVEFNDAEEDTTDEELAPRRGRRYMCNSANNQVFEMEVFHCSKRNDHEESSAGSLQDVRL